MAFGRYEGLSLNRTDRVHSFFVSAELVYLSLYNPSPKITTGASFKLSKLMRKCLSRKVFSSTRLKWPKSSLTFFFIDDKIIYSV